jgi:hypothetical protein
MATKKRTKKSRKVSRMKPNAERANPTISLTVNPVRIEAVDYAIECALQKNPTMPIPTRSSLITSLMPQDRVTVDTFYEYLKFHKIEYGDISDVYEACFLQALKNDMMGPAVQPNIFMQIAAVCPGDSAIADRYELMSLYKKYVMAKLGEDGYFFDEVKVTVEHTGTFTETIVVGPNDSEDIIQTIKGRIRLKLKALWQNRSP